MSRTHIVSCDCNNKYQDEKYGYKKRVANEIKKMDGNKIPYCRCTVCGKERVAK